MINTSPTTINNTTSTLTAENALNQAKQLKRHFSSLHSEIVLMQPQESVPNLYQLWQSPQYQSLLNLGMRVNNTTLGKPGNIANATEGTLNAISEKLLKANSFVEEIEAGLLPAFKLCAANRIYDGVFGPTGSGGNYGYEDEGYFEPTPVGSSVSNAQLMTEQNETYEIFSRVDRLYKLLQDPEKSKQFEEFLKLYTDHNNYIQKTKFVLEHNQTSACKLLKSIQENIEILITRQVEAEKTLANPAPSSGVSDRNLKALKETIQAIKDLSAAAQEKEVMEKNTEMKQSFAKLSSEERSLFFDSLSGVLIEEKTRKSPLSEILKNKELSSWTGSPAQKIKALDKVLSTLTPQAPSQEVKKESEKMKEAFEKAKAAQYVEPIGISSPKSPFNQVPSFPMEKLRTLCSIAQLLQDDSSTKDFYQAIEELANLDFKGPHFHVYRIRKNEPNGEPLPSDDNYGEKAMGGHYSIDNSVRRRALQCAIVEYALEELGKAVAGNVQTLTVELVLSALEGLSMDPKDLPDGKNMAHALCGHLFDLQCKARESNPSLANPSDSKFKSDFGRWALYCSPEEVAPVTKIAAIQRLHEGLKKAWKI